MVSNRVARGVPPIPREPPIMKDLDKLAGLPPRSPTESLSVLERGDPGRDLLGVDPKKNLQELEPVAHFGQRV